MAGDWIKVEHATLDKPEVLRTAEMLGISRRETVGLFVEYFFWLDKTLSENCPDFVRNVSRKSLDEMMHCSGFACCLEAVGWAEFDDAAWTLRVINASNHNGKPAKTRAVDAKRKAGKRLESVREMSGEKRTREEKKRTTPIVPDAFAEFWLLYPRKDKKGAALTAWRKLAPDAALQARILNDVRRRAAGLDWQRDGGQFIPHPSSYLNGRRFEDEGASLPEPATQPSEAWRRAL